MNDRKDAQHPMERRCTARNRRGQQCGRYPIPGGNVCVMHGGGAPQVQARAKQRLAAMIDPALATVRKSLKAKSERVALSAAQDVLDRNGVGTDKAPDPGGTGVVVNVVNFYLPENGRDRALGN